MYTYTKCQSCPYCSKITISLKDVPIITVYGDYEDIMKRKIWMAEGARNDLAVRSMLTWLNIKHSTIIEYKESWLNYIPHIEFANSIMLMDRLINWPINFLDSIINKNMVVKCVRISKINGNLS